MKMQRFALLSAHCDLIHFDKNGLRELPLVKQMLNSCRTVKRTTVHPRPHGPRNLPHLNLPYPRWPRAPTYRSAKITTPSKPGQPRPAPSLITTFNRLSPGSVFHLKSLTSIWRSVCWIRSGKNREIDTRRRKNSRRVFSPQVKLKWLL